MGRIGIELFSAEDTLDFGKQIADLITTHQVLALFGDLGAGKTTFVKGLAEGLGISDLVQSPTFVTLNLYEGRVPLYHFDLYRLKGESDFVSQGFLEYLDKQGVCAIEWPDRIVSLLPPGTLSIHFFHTGKGRLAIIAEGTPC